MTPCSIRSVACLAVLAVAAPAAADTHSASPVHSTGSSSSSSSSSGSSHSASPVRRAPSASGWSSSGVVRFRPYRHTRYYRPLWWAPAPVLVVGSNASVSPVDADDGPSDVRFGASGQVLAMGGLLGFGADMALEGRHVGLFLEAAVLPMPGTTTGFAVLDASVAFSLLSGEAGRLRVEVGALSTILSSGDGSGLLAAAPGVGVSGALAVAGPLLLTGRVRGAIWPYLRAEGQAGALLALGPVGLQLGWRTLFVADAYQLANAGSRFFSGPYVGVEVAL